MRNNQRKTQSLPDDLMQVATLEVLQIRQRLSKSRKNDLPQAVHESRKRIKKLRALFRLTRNHIGEAAYQKLNHIMRAIAHSLSPLRDAAIRRETWHEFRPDCPDQISDAEFSMVAESLSHQSDQRIKTTALSRNQYKKKLGLALALIKKTSLNRITKKELRKGMKKTHNRYQREYRKARQETTDESLHAWRKRSKDLLHQLDLLGHRGKRVEQLRELGKLLGADHDLAILKSRVLKISPGTFQKLQKTIERKRADLQKAAWRLGKKLN